MQNHDYSSWTDAMLVQCFRVSQTGKEYEELYRRYYMSVLNYCTKMVKEREAAFDLTQEIFVKIGERLHQLKMEDRFESWLFRIAHNSCMDYLKKQKRYGIQLLDEQYDTIAVTFDEEAAWQQERMLECLELALHSASCEIKQLLISKYYENKSIKEIQELSGLSESAIKMRLARARKGLLRALKGAGVRN